MKGLLASGIGAWILEYIKARHYNNLKLAREINVTLKKNLGKDYSKAVLFFGDPDKNYSEVVRKWENFVYKKKNPVFKKELSNMAKAKLLVSGKISYVKRTPALIGYYQIQVKYKGQEYTDPIKYTTSKKAVANLARAMAYVTRRD